MNQIPPQTPGVPRPPARKDHHIPTVLKILVAAILLTVLFTQVQLEDVIKNLKNMDFHVVPFGVATLLAHITINSYRWKVLSDVIATDLNFQTAFKLTYLGALLNNFMPGSVGGDIARLSLMISEHEKRVVIAGTVIADRVLGLATIILISLIVTFINIGNDRVGELSVYVAAIFGCFAIGAYVYFHPRFRGSAAVAFVKNRIPFKKFVSELDSSFKQLRYSGAPLKYAALLSIISQFFLMMTIFILASALGFERVGLMHVLTIFPLIALFTAVPVSPGGLGVQELGFVFFFNYIGVLPTDQAGTLSLMYRMLVIIVTLPSLIILLLPASGRATPLTTKN